ncbi:hypothetical protein N9444_00060 [Gammaproteobacteria bacterium]|nr:hypothetical protein [Gammaproteobacteria bacterium]
MFKIPYSYKPATLLTLLCTVSVSPVSLMATAADLADYDYKKAVNGKLLIYKYSGVNAADRVRVGRYIRQAQKFLSARPPTATHIHMFHTRKSDLLVVGKKHCQINKDTWHKCPSDFKKYSSSRDASAGMGGRLQIPCQIVLGQDWWDRNSSDSADQQMLVAAHEYFHCYQGGLASKFESRNQFGWPKYRYPDHERGVGVEGPYWLVEGAASYFAANIGGKRGHVDYETEMRGALDKARAAVKKGAKLEKYISQKQARARDDSFEYNGGQWAMAYLAHKKKSNRQVFINYYRDLAELEQIWRKKGRANYGWQKSFQKNFGVTPKAFYKMFHKFMKKSISKQMSILMTPAKL